jgi:hypothetical protein
LRVLRTLNHNLTPPFCALGGASSKLGRVKTKRCGNYGGETMDFDKSEDEGIMGLVKMGSEMTGSAIATVAGFFIAGPGGAAVGAAASPLLIREINKIGNDVAERYLSERERVRIGAVIIYAKYKISKNLEAGKQPRSDFTEIPVEKHPACTEIPFVVRPSAEEIIEGVLLAAQREHEEKKVPFLGNLLGNIAFDLDIDKEQANLLIKLGKDLSFRQLCLLSLFASSTEYWLRDGSYEDLYLKGEFFSHLERVALLQEIKDLTTQELLSCGGGSYN